MKFKQLRYITLLLFLVIPVLPSQAVYLSEDPAEGRADNAPSLHRYLYSYQNPSVYVDPDGRAPVVAELMNQLLNKANEINVQANEFRDEGTVAGHTAGTLMNIGAGVHNVLGGAVGLVNTLADGVIVGSASQLENAGVEFREYGTVSDSRANLRDVADGLKQAGNTVVNFHKREVRSAIGESIVETAIGVYNGDSESASRLATTATSLGFGGGAGKLASSRLPSRPSTPDKVITESDSGFSPNVVDSDVFEGASDQKMIDTIVNHRAQNNTSNHGTLGAGRDGNGELTPVRESTVDGKSHAEIQVMEDLKDRPKPHTIAVDQKPCSNCQREIKKNNIDKVIVPRDTNPQVHKDAEKLGRKASPKTSAVKASQGKTSVVPEEVDFDEK